MTERRSCTAKPARDPTARSSWSASSSGSTLTNISIPTSIRTPPTLAPITRARRLRSSRQPLGPSRISSPDLGPQAPSSGPRGGRRSPRPPYPPHPPHPTTPFHSLRPPHTLPHPHLPNP